MKILNFIGSINTVESELDTRLVILNCFKEMIDEMSKDETIWEVVEIDDSKILAELMKRVMRKTRGSLNPMKIKIIFDDIIEGYR